MTTLESLYLDPARSGVPWLLDPDNPDVIEGLRNVASRKPSDPCDAEALSADLPDLLRLLQERHFGLATGEVDDAGMAAWSSTWQHRLATEHPTTWGAATGTDMLRLRQLLRDGHAQAYGEDPKLLMAANPRRAEPTATDTDGPIVEEHIVDGVLALRVRRWFGTREDDDVLTDWAAAHKRHFRFDHIVLDLRGNDGGSDTYCTDWMADHLPAATQIVPDDRGWTIDGKLLVAWNTVVAMTAQHGADSVPSWLLEWQPHPTPDSVLTIEPSDNNQMPAGSSPWHGRMLVLTDRRSGSSSESSGWMLRRGLGARIAGRASAGTIRFGQVAPYLLPRSELAVMLATKFNDYPTEVELAGIPVDIPLDPRLPLADVAADFNRIWAMAHIDERAA